MTTATNKHNDIDVFTMPVFPPADIFPMMDKEELIGLATDIAANGLREPLVIGEVEKKWLLIDGRNRREGCRLAKIKNPPTIILPSGEDLIAYLLSRNIHRRHLNKGQQAIIIARLYPNSEMGAGAKDPGKKSAHCADLSMRRVQQARFILKYAEDLADSVVTGGEHFADALQEAQMRKAMRESKETRLEILRENASDLADLVDEDQMKLSEAEAAYEKREAERIEEMRIAKLNLESVLRHLTPESAKVSPSKRIQCYIPILADFDIAKLSFALQSMKLLANEKDKQMQKHRKGKTK